VVSTTHDEERTGLLPLSFYSRLLLWVVGRWTRVTCTGLDTVGRRTKGRSNVSYAVALRPQTCIEVETVGASERRQPETESKTGSHRQLLRESAKPHITRRRNVWGCGPPATDMGYSLTGPAQAYHWWFLLNECMRIYGMQPRPPLPPLACSSMVEPRPVKAVVVGSTPTGPANRDESPFYAEDMHGVFGRL
jgi:hypothetical protein